MYICLPFSGDSGRNEERGASAAADVALEAAAVIVTVKGRSPDIGHGERVRPFSLNTS